MSEPSRSLAREVQPLPQPEDLLLGPEAETGGDEREQDLARRRSVARQKLLWEHRRQILRAGIAAALASTLIAFLIPARYESTARLMPPDQPSAGLALLSAAGSGGGTQMGTDLGSLAGSLLGLKNSSDLFIGVLGSRTVEDDLVTKFDLQKVYGKRRIEDARKKLRSQTDLSADRKSGIISIEVEDHSAERASALAGEYVSALNRVITQLNTSSAHREREFLEGRLVEVKQDLENAEQGFSQFASKNTALDIPTQGKAVIEGVATLQGQLIAAETELQGLRQIYADGNVRVRSAQARVDELQSELRKDLSSQGPTGGDGSDPTSLFPSIRQLPVIGVSYADLYRNTKVQEAVFQVLTQQYELAKVQEAKETPSVKVLDAPDVPDQKSFPPRSVIILFGAMFGMAACAFWVLGKNSWDQTDSADPQKVFANEVLHSVRASMWKTVNRTGSERRNGANGNGVGRE
jgi:uncharacterized protein involved in exopolysaccharide biosynthesis